MGMQCRGLTGSSAPLQCCRWCGYLMVAPGYACATWPPQVSREDWDDLVRLYPRQARRVLYNMMHKCKEVRRRTRTHARGSRSLRWPLQGRLQLRKHAGAVFAGRHHTAGSNYGSALLPFPRSTSTAASLRPSISVFRLHTACTACTACTSATRPCWPT